VLWQGVERIIPDIRSRAEVRRQQSAHTHMQARTQIV
jgi:hypothetical protein